MSGSQAEQLVGAVLNGRWRLVRLLGEGGMGAVYEADGTRGEGKRAIKLLHQEFVKEGQILSRFFAEAHATRLLHHPNVAQVFDSATAENGTPYLVMELLQGMPLADYMDQNHAVQPPMAIPIIYGVLQALSLAHGHRIIHRDIKPDNVFLVREGNGALAPKVLDFGIAKVMDGAGGMGQKTRTGVLLGTPGYMSPEQIKNSKAVDPRSDLWSVGIMFYELLTGASPFPADNDFTRLTSVLSEEVKPIEQHDPRLSMWGPFFHRALAKDPAQRFQGADEMAGALMSVSRGGSMRPPATQAGAGMGPVAATAQGTGPVMPPRAPMQSVPSIQMGGPVSMPFSMPPHSLAGHAGQPGPPSMASPHSPLPSPVGPAPPPASPSSMSVVMPPPVVPTQVSALKPAGTPTLQGTTPAVEIVAAPPIPKSRAPWWLVFVALLVGVGIGLGIGLAVRR